MKILFQLSLLMLLILGNNRAVAQPKYIAAEGSTVAVKGTSTLHDWKMVSDSVVSTADFKESSDDFEMDLYFSVRVKTLKSRMNKINTNAYEALRAEEYPYIRFRAVSAEKADKNGNRIKLTGDLTIAGVTQRKTVMLEKKVLEDGKIVCVGDIDAYMSDFGLEPPKGMGGLIKAKDEITISYEMNYSLGVEDSF